MATRTIFFHISGLQQAAFYLLAVAALGCTVYPLWRQYRLWSTGAPSAERSSWAEQLRGMLTQVAGHRRIKRRTVAGVFHSLIFYGMLALFLGTCIVAVEHYGALLFGAHWFYKGGFYLAVKLVLDFAGIGLIVGIATALGRRHLFRPAAMKTSSFDSGFLALLLAATVTGLLVEGAGIAADPARQAWAGYSPVGGEIAHVLPPLSAIQYDTIWWIHIILVLSVIALLSAGRRRHLFIIPATILLQPKRVPFALPGIDLAAVEETGKIGLATITDLDRWSLMSLDGCMSCGRCTQACPANAAAKPLDPQQIVADLRSLLAPRIAGATDGVGSTDIISDAALWACTSCGACVTECPALIRHVDIINGIRRFRVAEGRLTGPPAVMLRQLASREDPWGLPASQRLDWARGLEIPTASADDNREVLLWVGCAGAFDPRAQKSVRALSELLQKAGVRFSVLGPKERCTGDPARRTGDELQFMQLAGANVSTLNSIGAKRIVTTCPHCMNTLKNEYPALGGAYTVQHHTELLQELVNSGRLRAPVQSPNMPATTYHDPCYLARGNGITAAPRSLLAAAGAPVLEPERNSDKTFCCGAGGGRMWMEDRPEERPGLIRARELIATGAQRIAVGCPFCKIMVGDSVAHVSPDQTVEVLDVAEAMLQMYPD